MDEASIWLTDMKSASADLFAVFIAYLPYLVGAVLILLAGWLLARLARTMVLRMGDATNRLLDAVMPTGRLARFRLSPSATQHIGNAVYWLVMFFTITATANVAGLDTFSSWLDSIVAYLPNLLGGGLIILVGYMISEAIRDLVSTTLQSMEVAQGELIGALAQWAAFLTAIIIGIEQVGVDVTFLTVVIAIVVASLLGGMALAFGLGARPLATNLIGAHYLQQSYSIGQSIKIGAVEGRLLQFSPTGLVIETDEGQVSVPGCRYFDDQITLKDPATQDD